VCKIHDRLMMLMESMNFLGLRIESGSGLVFGLSFEYLFTCIYDDFSMDVMYMDY
jgi:hypothetical protein